MAEVVTRLAPRGVAHTADSPTLQLEGVSVYLSSTTIAGPQRDSRVAALEDVSFTVNEGERVAVVGPNGAGKSTLIKLIVGTVRPSVGDVNIYGSGPDDHVCIAYVPQRNHIDWSFPATVKDVVMMGRVSKIGLFKWPKSQDWAIVRAALQRVNAENLAERQVGELSGGQQQRVFIARALAQEAELLLLDEPMTGLDVSSQEALFDVLESVRDDGVAVLLATHDLNLAEQRFDRVLLLNKYLVAYGQPEEVLTPSNLMRAYGGQLHVLGEQNTLLLADDCCGQGEHEPHA